jgi:hypothetical protein
MVSTNGGEDAEGKGLYFFEEIKEHITGNRIYP